MKNTREITTEYRMGQWAAKMAERGESGLSIVKYCEKEGMPTNRYFYWQRRLRAAAELALREAETAQLPPSGWTQLRTVESEKAEPSEVSIEIGKCRVKANESSSPELLSKVCKVLVDIC
jgi:hypothetical protein